MAPLTFLFTDIEGSTRRWELHPDAMRAALARHDALLRHEIEGHGGRVFKTVGDAFCAVFNDPLAAARAAFEVHQRLAAEEWGVLGPLRVRASIHSGDAQERGGDYFGPTLNRVARILSAGHGGQTLLSERAASHVRESVDVHGLGEHRLKDLIEPERIFQLGAERFPALHTLTRAVRNLPAASGELFGRQSMVLRALELLLKPEVRLLTLVAPGGTGKTRLSMEIARAAVDLFLDGIDFVPLAAVTDPLLVPSAIARELGLREAPEQSSLDALVARLKHRRQLLVLDNFEQVMPAAQALRALLDAAPSLSVLVTSRIALRLAGAQELAVPLLDVEPAVKLFVERARATRSDLAFDASALEAVQQICLRVDCLPLAIELAAARCRVLQPQAILERLEESFAILRRGASDAPDRHHSVRATVDWSYRLLTPAEQQLFRRLSAFAGGFDLDEAGATGGLADGEDPLDAVSALVEKCLLVPGASAQPRFSMLETIREYGLGALEAAGELASARERHARHFFELAKRAEPELRGPAQGTWLTRCEAELPNLRAALDWAAEHRHGEEGLQCVVRLRRFWEGRSYVREALDRLGPLLALDPTAKSVTRARALAISARFEWLRGHAVQGLASAEASLALAAELGTEVPVPIALQAQAAVLLGRGEAEKARAIHERAFTSAEAAGDWEMLGRAHNFAGELDRSTGNVEGAVAHYQRALEILRPRGDECWAGIASMNWAYVELRRGQRVKALELLREAIATHQRIHNEIDVLICLIAFAGAAEMGGQARVAARLLSAAQAQSERLGLPLQAADAIDFKRYCEAGKAALGEPSWMAEWAEGAGLSLEEAAALAETLS